MNKGVKVGIEPCMNDSNYIVRFWHTEGSPKDAYKMVPICVSVCDELGIDDLLNFVCMDYRKGFGCLSLESVLRGYPRGSLVAL